jgi:hypothetical protein
MQATDTDRLLTYAGVVDSIDDDASHQFTIVKDRTPKSSSMIKHRATQTAVNESLSSLDYLVGLFIDQDVDLLEHVLVTVDNDLLKAIRIFFEMGAVISPHSVDATCRQYTNGLLSTTSAEYAIDVTEYVEVTPPPPSQTNDNCGEDEENIALELDKKTIEILQRRYGTLNNGSWSFWTFI